MKVKVKDLSGKALDWAVATAINAEKIEINDDKTITVDVGHTKYCDSWAPSSDWEQIGPLVDRFRMDIEVYATFVFARLQRGCYSVDANEWRIGEVGPNHKVAACRAVVAAFLCDRKSSSVEIPEELL